MTSRERTGLLPLPGTSQKQPLSERALVWAWGAIQWPWLARSLWGGRKAEKRLLLDRLGLAHDALPNLGSWKADTTFLLRLIDIIEASRPRVVVELGCGATSLVIGRALQLHGGGQLIGFDQHAAFVEATAQWLAGHGVEAQLWPAPIVPQDSVWASRWYQLPVVPDAIDLLVIDGPPWVINPFVRGHAEVLFDRIAPGGLVLLDDAARPGERVVATRWKKRWPDFRFTYLGGGKGTLVGQRGIYS
ncbi:class I SAM-dependent methyltransferase [Altererythrobacter lauratis]|uniref:Class I SAM-dependent methyltransferase n=1 Tax=Alteraurantiacibacter lauratis TaxID=2054627 RepID=A0ABV7ELA5_9SPHN